MDIGTFILSLRDFYRQGENPNWHKDLFEYWLRHKNEVRPHFQTFSNFLAQVDGQRSWLSFGSNQEDFRIFSKKKKSFIKEINEEPFYLSKSASPPSIGKTYVLSDISSGEESESSTPHSSPIFGELKNRSP